jgi:hypothetical protein
VLQLSPLCYQRMTLPPLAIEADRKQIEEASSFTNTSASLETTTKHATFATSHHDSSWIHNAIRRSPREGNPRHVQRRHCRAKRVWER